MITDVSILRAALLPLAGPETAFIFDLGQVVVTYDNRRVCERFAESARADAEEINQFLHVSEVHAQFHCGVLDPIAFYNAAVERLGIRLDLDAFWADFVSAWELPDEAMITLADDLHALGSKTAILSNMDHMTLVSLRRRCPMLFASFDAYLFSCETGTRKPEPKAYDNVRTILPRRRYVFTDDKERNLAPARELGWTTIQFHLPGGRD